VREIFLIPRSISSPTWVADPKNDFAVEAEVVELSGSRGSVGFLNRKILGPDQSR
jgi:hypothetical protein